MTDNYTEANIEIMTKILSSLVEEVYQKILTDIESQFKDILAKLEKYEDQVATIVYAYGEQAIVMEALTSQLEYATPEAQKAFTDSLSEQRKKMIQVLNESSKGFMADNDPGIARALGNLVEKKLSDTN
jgi:methyl-accepting chemotaxis protein